MLGQQALERLEPCAGKLARTVLRRVEAGNGFHLSDSIGLQTPNTTSDEVDLSTFDNW